MTADLWPDLPWPTDEALATECRQFAAEWRGDRAALATITGAKAMAAADSLAIVTGQQPAVGGGPLYTLVKTAHAVVMAARLRAQGVNAVPVFWCASEDHDLGEANHADLVTRDGRIRRVAVDLGAGRASLRFRPASRWWDVLVAECRELGGGTLGATWLDAHRPNANEGMGAWLCRLMTALFARHGLVCVEAHQLRPLWTPTLRRAIEQWPTTTLAERRRELLDGGAADALGALDQPPLFRDDADGREALTLSEMNDLVLNDPTLLSPGAGLRPVLQQAALPAALYVAGPGEVAYHRFLSPLYAALAVSRPRLMQRASLTLVPSWVERAAHGWGRSLDELLANKPVSIDEIDVAGLSALDAALLDLEQQMSSADADRARRLRTGLDRLRRERNRLAASLARGKRRQADRPAWGTLTSWISPRGQRQERTMSLFQAVWEHGPGVVERMIDGLAELPPGGHGILALRS